MRPHRVSRHGVPLSARRERGAPAAEEPRVGHLADDACRAHVDRRAQRGVAARGPVAVEALWVDLSDPAQEPKRRVARLRHQRRRRRRRGGAGERGGDVGRPGRGDLVLGRVLSGRRHERGGSPLAHPQARALEPDRGAVPGVLARRADCPLELRDELVPAPAHAGDVGADVGHERRARLEREERVEARDAIGLGGRDREPPADIAERGGADPADAALHLVEHRKQQMPLRACRVPTAGRMAVGAALAADPRRRGRAQHAVDRVALGRRRGAVEELQVHAVTSRAPRAAWLPARCAPRP